jgi:hypothetical protein
MNTITKVVVALILVGVLGGVAQAQYRRYPHHQVQYSYVPVPVNPYYSGNYPTLAQYQQYQMYQLQQYQLMQQQWQYQQQLQQQYALQQQLQQLQWMQQNQFYQQWGVNPYDWSGY